MALRAKRCAFFTWLVIIAIIAPAAIYPAYGDSQSDAFSEAMRPFEKPAPAPDDTDAPPSETATDDSAPVRPAANDAADANTDKPAQGPQDSAGSGTAEGSQPPAVGDGESVQPGEQSPTENGEGFPALLVPEKGSDVISLSADKVYRTKNFTRATGNIHLAFEDYEAAGNTLELDKDRILATLEGNVVVSNPNVRTLAEWVELNLENEHWNARNSLTTIQPSFFETTVAEPLYLTGRDIHGQPGSIDLSDGRGTSCEYTEDPHYELRTSSVHLVPEDYVVFRKPTFYFLGQRVFRYPFDLRLSLKSHTNRFLPEVGQNEVEGYFAKFAYAYLLNPENSGVLRLNATEKRGTGYGVDHSFDFGENYGDLTLFTEPQEGSWSGRLSDHHQFSDSLTADLRSNIQRYSGFSAGSTSFNNDLTFRRRTDDSDSLLGWQQSISESGTNTSRRTTLNATHRENVSDKYSWEMRTVMRRNAYRSDQAGDEELNTSFSFRGRERSYTWDAQVAKRYDLDGGDYTGDDNFYALDQMPEISISTDSSQLDDYRVFGQARMRATVNIGRFDQQPDNTQVSRAGIDLSLPGHSRNVGGSKELHNSARFRQQFFTDGSAQWAGELRSQLRGRWGSTWDYQFVGAYSTSDGFSPLRSGYSSKSANINFAATRRVADKMNIDVGTGYDFRNNYYSDATFSAEFMLAKSSRLELQGGYSIERGEWRPLNARWLRATPSWYSALTAYYDLPDSKLTRATTEITWRISDLWQIDLLAGYTGYTHQLDQLDFQLYRDLHCMSASVSYNKELSEFRVNLGIKAFPSNERVFGVGAGGAQFESNFSQYY